MEAFNSKSGPRSVLHQNSGEVREHQFEVIGPCTADSRDKYIPDSEFALRGPFVIWVFWPPEPPNALRECPSLLYRLTPASVLQVEEMFGRTIHPERQYVCEHMGRLIE